MKVIELTRGRTTIVDDGDFDLLNQFKWHYSPNGNGYVTRNGGHNKAISIHRFLLNPPQNKEIDHKNGNGLDNRRCNLRICEHQDNTRNRKLHKNNTSGHKGVYPQLGRWGAGIRVNGKQIHLGFFTDKKEAAKRYNEAAIKYFGEFAKLN